jgi:threonine dehydrogenase-like Zn-dependent dehydrogenase
LLGLVFLGERHVELSEFPDPVPGPHEVVVEIKASGLCGSDLHQYRADSPSQCIGGHEPSGVVCAVGGGVDPLFAAIGDRVTLLHYAGCTVCDQCRAGWFQLCEKTTVRYGADAHGSHAAYMLVPAATLVALPGDVSFEAGAAIGCGTGTAWGALRRLGDMGGTTLTVFGQGPVGLSATMLATALGAEVIAVDISETRLRNAQRFGAAYTIDAAQTNVEEAITELTNGQGVPHVLETSGSSQAATSALASLSTWGRACFVGLGGPPVQFAVGAMLRKQPTIMTSWTLSIVELSRCVDFVARHQLPVDDLFTHRWRLDEAAEAYAEFDRQDSGKGVFVF